MSVDELMKSHVVKMPEGGHMCLVCGKAISAQIRRHLRDIHLSSEKEYHCPDCNRYFKNRQRIYQHVIKTHKNWPANIIKV